MTKFSFITKKRSFSPLSLSGIIITSAMISLLLGPGKSSNDLLATTIACCFLALLLALGILTLISYYLTKKNFNLNIYVSSDNLSGKIVAGETVKLKINQLLFRLLPFTRAEITLGVDDENLDLGTFEITGFSSEGLTLGETITFPHRGIWNIEEVSLAIKDAAGLWNFKLKKSIPKIGIKVEPPLREYTSLSVLSSVYTAGDTVPLGEQRLGDFYDLKSYHPSDGIKRIAWKIFAKSGTLIARQPEKEIQPDGKALIFLSASAQDDQICAECLAYIKYLESLDIEILFDCESSNFEALANNSSSALELIIEASRRASAKISKNLKNDINYFLEKVKQEVPDVALSVIIFVGENRLQDSEKVEELLSAIGQINSWNIEPILVCRNPELLELRHQNSKSHLKKLRNLVLESSNESATNNSQGLYQLLSATSKKNWSIITCP